MDESQGSPKIFALQKVGAGDTATIARPILVDQPGDVIGDFMASVPDGLTDTGRVARGRRARADRR